MDILEALRTRRSVRNYTNQPVTEEEVREILKCAMLAPSACNEKPWHFVVAREAATREALARATPYTGPAAKAQVVIVLCGDLGLEKAPGFWVQDCSAAMENLLVAARGKNIGSVWCGIYPASERVATVQKIVNLPDNVIPLGLACLGHTSEEHFREADRFDESRIHLEKW